MTNAACSLTSLTVAMNRLVRCPRALRLQLDLPDSPTVGRNTEQPAVRKVHSLHPHVRESCAEQRPVGTAVAGDVDAEPRGGIDSTSGGITEVNEHLSDGDVW